MKIDIQRSEDRGRAEHDWLQSRFSFSFAEYYNPKRMGFGALRVINDDYIAPAGGFPMHSHHNMEIVTIVLEGALEHQDNQGNHGVIRPGDVQRMTAGSGIRHSEFNASKTERVHLLQIWVIPEKEGLMPGYEQKTFDLQKSKNQFQTLVMNAKKSGAVYFNQNGAFSRGIFDAGKTVSYKLHKPSGGLYLFVISGEIIFKQDTLRSGDAAAITEATHLDFRAVEKTDLLAIEVPL